MVRTVLGVKATEPLFAIGTFGTHVIKNPAGSFSFTGEVPVDLKGTTYKTEDEGIDAFVAWYRQTSESFQSKNCKNLRTDIFAYCLTGTKKFV